MAWEFQPKWISPHLWDQICDVIHCLCFKSVKVIAVSFCFLERAGDLCCTKFELLAWSFRKTGRSRVTLPQRRMWMPKEKSDLTPFYDQLRFSEQARCRIEEIRS